MKRHSFAFALTLLLMPLSLSAQSDPRGTTLQNIPFETLPPGVGLVAGGGITLDGATLVTQGLTVQGTIESTAGGVRFPDGTVQTTAASTGGAQTANSGLYDNRIPEFTPPEAYSEICFKASSVQADIHTISESPAGGSCEPGDLGWVIERDERTAASWGAARIQCLLLGMRLPEPFEWRASCVDAATFGLNDMTGNAEWASNTAVPSAFAGTVAGTAVSIFGSSSCDWGSFGWLGKNDDVASQHSFRCVL